MVNPTQFARPPSLRRTPSHETVNSINSHYVDEKKQPHLARVEESDGETSENVSPEPRPQSPPERFSSELAELRLHNLPSPQAISVFSSHENLVPSQLLNSSQRALLQNPLYRYIRHRTILEIADYLHDDDRRFIASTAMGGFESYLTDPQYYNPSRNASKHRFPPSTTIRPHHGHGDSSSALSAISHLLGPIHESPETKTRSASHQAVSHEKLGHLPIPGDTMEAPAVDGDTASVDSEDMEFHKGKLGLGYLRRWCSFVHYCLCDVYYNNPYKLPYQIYLGLGLCLFSCIIGKIGVSIAQFYYLNREPWNEEARKEAIRHMDSVFTILPYVVQLVLFLFPPILQIMA